MGLAVARELASKGASVVLLEKELFYFVDLRSPLGKFLLQIALRPFSAPVIFTIVPHPSTAFYAILAAFPLFNYAILDARFDNPIGRAGIFLDAWWRWRGRRWISSCHDRIRLLFNSLRNNGSRLQRRHRLSTKSPKFKERARILSAVR